MSSSINLMEAANQVSAIMPNIIISYSYSGCTWSRNEGLPPGNVLLEKLNQRQKFRKAVT
jgi:hypothetical protein